MSICISLVKISHCIGITHDLKSRLYRMKPLEEEEVRRKLDSDSLKPAEDAQALDRFRLCHLTYDGRRPQFPPWLKPHGLPRTFAAHLVELLYRNF